MTNYHLEKHNFSVILNQNNPSYKVYLEKKKKLKNTIPLLCWIIPIGHASKSSSKSIPYNPNQSSHFITDDMLAPYFPTTLPTSQIELTLSCKNIMSTHTIRQKSDPFCVVSVKRPWQDKYKILDRTETIENTRNPQWMKKIIVDYNLETINSKFLIKIWKRWIFWDDMKPFWVQLLLAMVANRWKSSLERSMASVIVMLAKLSL